MRRLIFAADCCYAMPDTPCFIRYADAIADYCHDADA